MTPETFASPPIRTTQVTLGSERLLASSRLDGLRVGVVCNPASVDRDLVHVTARLASRPRSPLRAIFGPQHGVHASAQDNMVETPHGRERRLACPVYSLYSETREPTDAMLADLDVLVIDLQDVGTRVYTFAYTMANCLRAAARVGLPVVVCDRPNPIGGFQVEGPVLQPGWESFVGQFAIPLRHGMTMGELAALFNEEFGLGARLDVIPMEGWSRDMYWDATGLPWVMPSPNIPTLDSAIVYPGGVLLEGTSVSEGRGTTRPFELVGAPWVDAETLVEELAGAALPGVHFRPVYFEPTFQKHAGAVCGGCQIHVTDRLAFAPVLTTIWLLHAIRQLAPDRFAWAQPPYEYETERLPIDVLYGSPALREALDAGATPSDIAARWVEGRDTFDARRSRHLRY